MVYPYPLLFVGLIEKVTYKWHAEKLKAMIRSIAFSTRYWYQNQGLRKPKATSLDLSSVPSSRGEPVYAVFCERKESSVACFWVYQKIPITKCKSPGSEFSVKSVIIGFAVLD
jgi:hypothetical protein